MNRKNPVVGAIICGIISNIANLIMTCVMSLERKGRFIPALTEIIDAICSMKSWVLPAHDWSDGRMGNFNGKVLSVDLRSSHIAATLAYSVNFLRDSLPAETCLQ